MPRQGEEARDLVLRHQFRANEARPQVLEAEASEITVVAALDQSTVELSRYAREAVRA